MQISLSKIELQSYISSQLNNFFPDPNPVRLTEYGAVVDLALDRLDFCFKHVALERYNKEGQTILNHLYSDQYLVFIWFLANTLYREKGHSHISYKLYYLNKALHSFDCMYDTALPDIFLVGHGAGTVLGKAVYNDFFLAMQGCTIGSQKGKYPVIGKGVAITSHSSVIGDCRIGDRATISSYTSIFEKDIPENSVAFTDRETGKLTIKSSKAPFTQHLYNTDLFKL